MKIALCSAVVVCRGERSRQPEKTNKKPRLLLKARPQRRRGARKNSDQHHKAENVCGGAAVKAGTKAGKGNASVHRMIAHTQRKSAGSPARSLQPRRPSERNRLPSLHTCCAPRHRCRRFRSFCSFACRFSVLHEHICAKAFVSYPICALNAGT